MADLPEGTEPDSMLVWWPVVRDIVPVPRTLIFSVPPDYPLLLEKLPYLIDEGVIPPGWEALGQQLEEMVKCMDVPFFLRTDLFSGKHHWKDTCYVDDASKLMQHLVELLQFGEECSMLGFRHRAIVLREYLPLESDFTAFRGDMPVAKERRWFIADHKVICRHPYWPKESMVRPSVADWEPRLAVLNTDTDEDMHTLMRYAGLVALAMDGAWSVDFAKTRDGRWVLIDMATAAMSWHPECPHAVSLRK